MCPACTMLAAVLGLANSTSRVNTRRSASSTNVPSSLKAWRIFSNHGHLCADGRSCMITRESFNTRKPFEIR